MFDLATEIKTKNGTIFHGVRVSRHKTRRRALLATMRVLYRLWPDAISWSAQIVGGGPSGRATSTILIP